MKKLLKIMAVLTMVLCLSVTAFASQGGSDTVGAVGPNGETAHITAAAPSVKPTAAQAAEVIAEKVPDVAAKDLTIPYVKDLTSDVLPVTITFEIPGATAEDTVYVLHYNGTDWEVVATCPGNAITATFTSLSPVALAMAKAPASSTPGTGETTSPKTGESNVVLYAGAVMVLAGAVALTAWKKKENA